METISVSIPSRSRLLQSHMLELKPNPDAWRLLTPKNIHTRQLWGWGYSIQKHVIAGEPKPRESGNLIIASDYGGDHPRSTHKIYCYLIVRELNHSWLSSISAIRSSVLNNNRTMSYKRLDDPQRQKALVPFLSAASELDGHLVTIAVDKKKKWLSTAHGKSNDFKRAFGLKASWNSKSLEAMMRKIHFAAILISIWSRPYTNTTWITDNG